MGYFSCAWCKHFDNDDNKNVCGKCKDMNRFKIARQTQADRIRAMSNDELAEWISDERECSYELTLNWLKQEVE